MSDRQIESPSAIMRWRRADRDPPSQGFEVEYAEGGKLWRPRPRKMVEVVASTPDPAAERQRIEAKQEQQFERHVIDVMKARYLAEFEE